MHSPKVTIVITCYNHQNYVIRSINSALNQSYSNINIIVIDDFSFDDSVQKIQSFIKKNPQIVFIKNASNLGHTKSFNQILNFCDTEYILDLAADDFLEENCIEKLVETFENIDKTKYFAVYGNCNLITENGKFIETYYPNNYNNPINENGYEALLNFENRICSVTALLNYSIFKTLNGYDTSLLYEDLDYWIRALRNYKIKYITDVLVNKTVLPNSLYRSGFKRNNLSKKINKSTLQILTKAYNLNKSKKEDFSLISRIRFEMKKNLKLGYITIFFNLVCLELKCRFRKF